MTSRQQKASSILLYRTRSPPQTADYSPYHILYVPDKERTKVEKETFFIEREEEIEKESKKDLKSNKQRAWGGKERERMKRIKKSWREKERYSVIQNKR